MIAIDRALAAKVDEQVEVDIAEAQRRLDIAKTAKLLYTAFMAAGRMRALSPSGRIIEVDHRDLPRSISPGRLREAVLDRARQIAAMVHEARPPVV